MDTFIPSTPVSQNKIRKFFNPKLIFLVLGAVILVELVFGLRALTGKSRSPLAPPPQAKPISGAQVILASPKKEYKVGENIPVSVRIDTGGHPTVGTDVVLKYDPRVVEASSSSILRGKVYAEYPLLTVDATNGLIRLSGIATGRQSSFNGAGVFGSLSLRAKKAGGTTVSVEFKKDQTDDSNVVEANSAKDILEEVKNLTITVK